jgi:TolA-binding protein
MYNLSSKTINSMKRLIFLILLIVATAVAAHAQTDTTIVSTKAVSFGKKAFIKTVTCSTRFEEVTAEMIVKGKSENEKQLDAEVERLRQQKQDAIKKRQERQRLIRQALNTAAIDIEAKTEEELKEMQAERAAARREKARPIRPNTP